MKNYKWPLQFLIAILISTFIQDSIQKTGVLLLFWLLTFYPIDKLEVLFFIGSSIVFSLSNFGALKNLVFEFTTKDIILMPYNEIFMWGFYCLNAHRFIEITNSNQPKLKNLLIYSSCFAVTFSIIHEEILLTFILLVLFSFALFAFKSYRAYKYIGYFLVMGFVVESSGLYFSLWNYPQTEFFIIPIWAPFMWANIGLIMSLVTTWFFNNRLILQSISKANNHRSADPFTIKHDIVLSELNNQTNDPFQELLDDPLVPFEIRWKIIQEIDRSNSIYFVFSLFMAAWNKYLSLILNEGQETYKVIEIGPGSGSLGIKILEWAKKRKLSFEYYLFDSQEKVLEECLKKFSEHKATQKLKASKNFLKDYEANSFDICLSLHVFHHIQPKESALESFEQMLRVSSKAVFMIDFEKQRRFLFRFEVLNFVFGFSKELSSDGIKSLQRAYIIDELRPDLKTLCDKYGYELKIKKYLIHPYFLVFALKKTF